VILAPDAKLVCLSCVKGFTEITGQIIRVGGSRPIVRIKTIAGQKIDCTAGKRVAQALGEKLYRYVTLEGEATWSGADFRVSAFQIERFEDFERIPLTQAFDELRERFGHIFDDIEDPDAWVKEQREG
jgi:hypothetical protein